SDKRGYSVNINTFNQSKSKIEVTLPNKNINNLDVYSGFGNVNLDGINAKKGSIYQDNKYLKIQNSKFDNLSFKSDAGGVSLIIFIWTIKMNLKILY
ncbi:DUF4097 family beta strand repeat-containing protein, partial [Staphylococcus haemolyticus]|uniref:DUF4097 family beta strand repeat-containing protein n=1 Tax=Staphylococcus haemolyticus TaxID=1283 RepID=UPI002596C424